MSIGLILCRYLPPGLRAVHVHLVQILAQGQYMSIKIILRKYLPPGPGAVHVYKNNIA